MITLSSIKNNLRIFNSIITLLNFYSSNFIRSSIEFFSHFTKGKSFHCNHFKYTKYHQWTFKLIERCISYSISLAEPKKDISIMMKMHHNLQSETMPKPRSLLFLENKWNHLLSLNIPRYIHKHDELTINSTFRTIIPKEYATLGAELIQYIEPPSRRIEEEVKHHLSHQKRRRMN
jgi:hypothetical protein